MNNQDRPNVARDLLRIHAVITRGMEVSEKNCFEILQKKEPAPKGFLDFLQAYSTVLRAHHQLEDELVFPYFRDKLKELPYQMLMSDHKQIDREVGTIDALLAEIRKGKNGPAPIETISGSLKRIREIWHPHIGIEEKHLSPVALEQMIPDSEQAILAAKYSRHAISHSQPAYLVLPFLLYNLDPVSRKKMTDPMPKMLVKFIMPVLWRRKWIKMKPYFIH
jgi:hemerythrin-like domain-containing protein